MDTSLLVYLNNQWNRLDIYEDIPISVIIQQVDINALDTRKSPYSKQFVVPNTDNNAKIFEQYYEVNGIDFNPLTRIDCVVQYRGTDIFTGILRLSAVIENPNYNCWCSYEELKEEDPDKVLTIEKINRKNYTLKQGKISAKDLIELIHKNNWTISANGVIFSTDKPSIVSELLADWFRLRQEYKKVMKDAYNSGDFEKGKLYNQKQHSIKILLNSVYGCFSINSWRYTDGYKMCSSAITTFGQRSIQETIRYANKLIESEYL